MRIFSKAIILALLTAAAVALSINLGWPAWVLFIGWVSYDLLGRSLSNSLSFFIQMALGIIMGILMELSQTELSGLAGVWALPIVVFFFMGSLSFIAAFSMMDNISAWFLGLIIFFGLHPDIKSFNTVSLMMTIAAGILFAWVNDHALKKENKKSHIKKNIR